MDQFFAFLNQLAIMAMKRSEIVGAVIVVATVFMMIMPLPTSVVDVLIALNICVSSLLIVLVMYLPGPLAFSSFPAVLLMTTMFRLALSVATTRLILLQQDAGDIVAAFGDFVVGGNLAVGLVVFLILTVVNFLVITKGSERVAEVSARFTLDAMPGKQMSIDSDLRAGLIDAEGAKRKREELGKESQLFGAMDGAMKFVKGDAIAGLVIVAVNLIGGFAVGVLQRDMSAGESMHLFSILTIGDGLIAQIPALLISLTAGMMITRVVPDSQELDANIGKDIAKQITSQPKAWIIASFGMIGFALLPGMPTKTFAVIAAIIFLVGTLQILRAKKQAAEEAAFDFATHNTDPENNAVTDVRQVVPSRYFLIQLHDSHQHRNSSQTLVGAVRIVRNRIVSKIGITLPALDIEYSDKIDEDLFRFCVHEVPTVQATLSPAKIAIKKAAFTGEPPEQGIAGSALREEEDYLWFDAQDALADNKELQPVTADTLLIRRMEQLFYRIGPQFIGLQETKALMAWLEHDQPELAQELQRIVPTSRFSSILRKLAAERIAIRSLRPIAETIIEHGQHERDIGALTDHIRIALKRQICAQYTKNGQIQAWLLSPDAEELFRDSLRQTQTETFFALPDEASEVLIEQLKAAFPNPFRNDEVLLVAQDLRRTLRALLEENFNHVPVLSFAELSASSKVNVKGRITVYGDNEDEQEDRYDDDLYDEQPAA